MGGRGLRNIHSHLWESLLWWTDLPPPSPKAVSSLSTEAFHDLISQSASVNLRNWGLTVCRLWGCHLEGSCINVCELVNCVWLFAAPWTVAHQASLSRAFCSQGYWMGCHSLLWGIFPTHRSNPGLLHCRQILYQFSHQRRKPQLYQQQFISSVLAFLLIILKMYSHSVNKTVFKIAVIFHP